METQNHYTGKAPPFLQPELQLTVHHREDKSFSLHEEPPLPRATTPEGEHNRRAFTCRSHRRQKDGCPSLFRRRTTPAMNQKQEENNTRLKAPAKEPTTDLQQLHDLNQEQPRSTPKRCYPRALELVVLKNDEPM